MTSLGVSSTLLEDIYAHRAVSSDGCLALATDAGGLPVIVSVGTDGRTYRVRPDADGTTGWALDDLDCPEALDVIAATATEDGQIIVVGGAQRSKAVHTLTLAADGSVGTWHSIAAGADVAGSLVFDDVAIRRTTAGHLEMLLLYFQRLDDPQWQYTYRVGRAALDAATWSVALSVGTLYTGPQPSVPASMVLRSTDGAPTLSAHWPGGSVIRSWVGIDGEPVVEDLTLPSGSSLAGLLDLGPEGARRFLAVGTVGSESGLFRVTGAGVELLSAGGPVASAAGTFTELTGYDVLLMGASGSLHHVGSPVDGAQWSAVTPLGDRVVGAVGLGVAELGPVFIAATLDKTMRHYVRSPESVDWQVEEIDVSTGTTDDMVWYTSKVTVADGQGAGIAGLQVVVSCDQTTEVLLNGRPDVVGPDRSVTVTSTPVGNLVVQQSTLDLETLFVPQLRMSLLTGENVLLEPYADVRDRLYAVTGDELRAATGRDGQPVLPADQQGNADEIASQVATAASLGLAPPAGVRLLPRAATAREGVVRFTPVGDSQALDLGFDPSDLWEAIKEGAVGAFTTTVTAIGEGTVTALEVVIDAAEGAYTVFVSTMEHAFDAIRAVLESVGAAFETVLEWLGTLFDWGAIGELAGEVAQWMRSGMGSITQLITLAGAPGSIEQTFTDLRSSAGAALDHVRSQIGASGTGAAAESAGFTNTDSIYTQDGTSYDNEANWLLDRLAPHLVGIEADFGISGAGWAGFTALSGVIAGSFMETGEAVADNVMTFFQQLATGEDLLAVTLDSVFDQFQAIVDGVLGALEGISTSLVSALDTLAASDALTSIFDTPISIPVVSDILAFLGLGDATVLDLISYLVAIPMHVVTTVMGSAGDAGSVMATPSGVYIALGILFLVILVMSSANDALSEAMAVLSVLTALVWFATTFVLLYGVLSADEPPPELVFATLLYIGYQAYALHLAGSDASPTATRGFAIYSIVDAVVLNVLAAVWEVRTKDDPEPPQPWQIVANHVGTLPDIFRWGDLAWPPPQSKPLPARLVIVAADVVGMGALVAGAFADYANADRARARAPRAPTEPVPV